MMLDAEVVACSPASVYRVLKGARLLQKHNTRPSSKGKGFVQPLAPHEHWHVDASYPTFRTDRSALSSDFRLSAEWSRQAVGGPFNAEEFKNLLGGLGEFVVERA
jgi:hypothetical protein